MRHRKQILIIYPNALMRLGLVSTIKSAAALTAYKICAYSKWEDALERFGKLGSSSIVVLDSSAWATLELEWAYARIQDLINHNISIVLIASIDFCTLKNIQARGIRGLLSPRADRETILKLFEDLSAGREKFFPEEHATLESQIYRLSNRQLEILRSLCRGQRARQVAGHLGISDSALKNHLEIIRKKCGLERTNQVVAAFASYFGPIELSSWR